MLYLNDHYLKEFDARVIETLDNKSLVLDRTALYPRGGGQPSDRGTLVFENGVRADVVESSKDAARIVHLLAEPLPEDIFRFVVDSPVHGIVDWDLRYKHMRHHTALHILSGVVYQKFHSRITGGQIYPSRARLDFTLDDLSKQRLAMIEEETNRVVTENRRVSVLWMSAEEALAQKDLYRLSADLLPKGLDRLRIVDIEGFDAQLDGGTHVARTGEIGKISISRTENKGRDNKRIEIVLSREAQGML